MTGTRVDLPASVRRAVDVSPRRAATVIVLASTVAVLFLVWLVVGVDAGGESSSVSMPLINAGLNLAAATFLVKGWRHVRAGRLDAHRDSMLGALACSAIFLIGYVTHHALHGDAVFAGTGGVRAVYLVLLAGHVVLSVLGLPFVLSTAWSATTERVDLHRRLARLTLPVWLYVSASGVGVAMMLTLWR